MRHGTKDWFKIGKWVHQGYKLSPCFFNLYAEYIMWNARLGESQTGNNISGRNINNLRYSDDTTLMTEIEEEINSLLMRRKRRVKKLAYTITFKKLRSWHLHPTLCNSMDCSLPGSSVHRILQARILEWVAISFSRGSSWSRDQTQVSYISRQVLYH